RTARAAVPARPCGAAGPLVAPPPRPADPAGVKDVRLLFESYCLDCHSGDAPRGGFALDRLLDAKSKDADRRQWEKVWKLVRHEFMPPAHADRPSDGERRAPPRRGAPEEF